MVADDSKTATNEQNENPQTQYSRKRRLSKKEQKQLKKQKRLQRNKEALVQTIAQTIVQTSAQPQTQKHDSKEQKPKMESKSKDANESETMNETNEISISYDYLKNYKRIEIPCNTIQSSMDDKTDGNENKSSLGKWFPTATLIKRRHPDINHDNSHNDDKKENNHKTGITSSCSILLFYQYANPHWSKEKVEQLTSYLAHVGQIRGLGGRIRVAAEGVNATISCIGETPSMPIPPNNNTTCNTTCNNNQHKNHNLPGCETIRHFAHDLYQFDSIIFQQTDFKYIDHLPLNRHFKDFKILPVQELVYYGIQEKDAPLSNGGIHLSPKDYHAKLGDNNCVVIDVRNHYEAAIGRFDGQMKKMDVITTTTQNKHKNNTHDKPNVHPTTTTTTTTTTTNHSSNINQDKTHPNHGGAEYIDPMMRKSTDFTSWLQKKETQTKLKGKQVLMYCTGGVRCERASAYLKTQLGDKLHLKGVYQLQGGIEKYLQEFPDGGYWNGKNFVFDKRESISADNPNGDGGVIRTTTTKKNKKNKHQKDMNAIHPTNTTLGPVCCCCGAPWDRYVGKKKCFTCGVPVLMCDKCMSKKTDKTPGKELSVRCPLCKKEGITVPANDVEYTENGKKSKGKKTIGTTASFLPATTTTTTTTTTTSTTSTTKCKEVKDETSHEKAASSVLKWGGGHASKKKEMRKFKRKKCHFGKDCVRKDCFFAH